LVDANTGNSLAINKLPYMYILTGGPTIRLDSSTRFCMICGSPQGQHPAYALHTTTIEHHCCPGWETFFCPGFPTRNARPGQKTGSGNQDKKHPPTGTKEAVSVTCLAHPFVPVGVTNRDKRSICFCFSFLNFFSISIILLHFN